MFGAFMTMLSKANVAQALFVVYALRELDMKTQKIDNTRGLMDIYLVGEPQ